MQLHNKEFIQYNKQQSKNKRDNNTKKHNSVTEVPSKTNVLLSKVSLLPHLMFCQNKGFVRLKTISLQNVASVEKLFNIMKMNSESLDKYNTQCQQKLNNSVHKNIIRNHPILKHSSRPSKLTLSPLRSKKFETELNVMSDILKIRINPKNRQSIKKIKQNKLKIQQEKREKYFNSLNMKINIEKLNNFINNPQCRQGQQIWVNKQRLFLIGGHSQNNKHCIQYTHLINKQWMKLQIQHYRKRSFHSCIIIEKQIYQLFGFQETSVRQQRRLSSQIDVINIETKLIKKLKVPSRFSPRIQQSACLLSSSVIIVCGGRTLSDYLNDCFMISLITEQFKSIGNLPFQKGLAGHKMCITNQGLYLFGGRSGNGQFSNKMLNFMNSKNMFSQVKTYGIPPQQCYGHNMHYLKYHDLIVIIGGKNDNLANPFLNQIILFNTQISTYFKLNNLKQQLFLTNGFYAGSASYQEKDMIFIYGGINLKGINTSIYIINFENNIEKASQQKQQDKEKM